MTRLRLTYFVKNGITIKESMDDLGEITNCVQKINWTSESWEEL